jgi:hypothetical protein
VTVSNQQTEFPYTGNGVTVTFAYSCQVQKAGDLQVYVNGEAITSGITKNGIGNLSGGSVTFSTAPASGAAVRLERVVVLERTTDYQQNGDFLARVVNPDFDRLWMALQQFGAGLSRALRFPRSDVNPVTELPPAAVRANKVLGFDSLGNPAAVIPESGSAADLALSLAGPGGVDQIGTILDDIQAVPLNLKKYMIQGQRYSLLGFIDGSLHSAIRNNTYNGNLQARLQYWHDACIADNHGGFIPNGTYTTGAVNYIQDGGAVEGITALKLLDGIDIEGESQRAIIKMLPFEYGPGAFMRMLSSRDGQRLRNARLHNFTVDGNRANQTASVQCNNITLECQDNVVLSYVRSVNSNGSNIMLRGFYGVPATNISVDHCTAEMGNNIAIQMSHAVASRISYNVAAGVADNCIDVYGENLADPGSTESDTDTVIIIGNNCGSGNAGIFMETLYATTAIGNNIKACNVGIRTNRINGEPRALNINGNTTLGCQIGALINGDGRGVTLSKNTFDNFSDCGVQIGVDNSGNVSGAFIYGNTFIPSANNVAIIRNEANQSSFNVQYNNNVASINHPQNLLYVNNSLSSIGDQLDNGFTVTPYQVGPVLQGVRQGTFTPTVGGNTVPGVQTYTAQTGTYTLIDRVVTFQINIALSAKDVATAGGSIRISGLPFVSAAGQSYGVTCSQAQFVTLDTGYTNVVGSIPSGQSYISVEQFGSNKVAAVIPSASFSATSTFNFSGSYNI